MDNLNAALVFARVAQDLICQPGTAATTSRIVELARSLTGCDLVALWHLSSTGTVLDASTDDDAARLVRDVLAGVPQATHWPALHSGEPLRVDDLLTEDRWPELRNRSRDAGLSFRSAVAYPLHVDSGPLGALVLYSDKPHFFHDDLLDVGAVLAAHAAVALESAHAADEVHHLSIALSTNRTVGMAIGILMAQHKITSDEAFLLLRVASQHAHRKLRDLAEDVVLTGELPTP